MALRTSNRASWFAGLLVLGAGVYLSMSMVNAREEVTRIPAPVSNIPKAAGPLQTAVLAGGCFWGIEGVFEHVKGVRQVLSGYAGGPASTANYSAVSSGHTTHAESVQITYDPAQVSYGELLHIFFSAAHDPTQVNRQGPDSGPQYRSAIFAVDDSQKNVAEAYIAQLNAAGVFKRPIATQVNALTKFYPAEEYHQDFMVKNPRHGYIVFWDVPKLRNYKEAFPAYYQERPMAVSAVDTSAAGNH